MGRDFDCFEDRLSRERGCTDLGSESDRFTDASTDSELSSCARLELVKLLLLELRNGKSLSLTVIEGSRPLSLCIEWFMERLSGRGDIDDVYCDGTVMLLVVGKSSSKKSNVEPCPNRALS
jgi:hypothetical protein